MTQAEADLVGAGPGPTAEAPDDARRRVPLLGWLAGALLPAALVLGWHLLAASGTFSPVQLPPPTAVLDAARGLWERGDLLPHVHISAQRVLVGFLSGSAVGLLLGAALGLSRTADRLVSPTVGAVRAVPSLAWVPLLILWLGIGEDSKVTLIAIGATFPVFTTVHQALRHVDPQLVEAARSFGLHGWRLLTTVQLPAVVPALFSGLRLALAQSWLFLVAAELIASSQGLGFLLIESQNNGRTDRLLLAIVLLAVLGKASDAVLGIVERWATRRWA
ncbi:ABC transporter permease [Nocardioides okcheonensis]|uniref:ABC transporter permease n=1 Tax=Nocardioides okcheonensis TaxID=2894081 RepID=UPI001E42AAFD|nr:ABC transporter permease subunit [Nocardioides okcheonensis]UFN46247.1 ABC transporter permease [Nocardioides okcheonensis]